MIHQSAYNYSAQKWETGAPAIQLRREQAIKHLQTLEGPQGASYLRFMGSKQPLNQAIHQARAEARQLSAGVLS